METLIERNFLMVPKVVGDLGLRFLDQKEGLRMKGGTRLVREADLRDFCHKADTHSSVANEFDPCNCRLFYRHRLGGFEAGREERQGVNVSNSFDQDEYGGMIF